MTFQTSSFVLGLQQHQDNLYACQEDGKVLIWDLNHAHETCLFQLDQSVNAIQVKQQVVYYVSGKSLYQFVDGSSQLLYTMEDEINALDIHQSSPFISMADDSGAVAVFDQRTKGLFKRFRSGHDNVFNIHLDCHVCWVPSTTKLASVVWGHGPEFKAVGFLSGNMYG